MMQSNQEMLVLNQSDFSCSSFLLKQNREIKFEKKRFPADFFLTGSFFECGFALNEFPLF